MIVLTVFCILGVINVTLAGTELLQNHDFENVNVNQYWTCQGGCTLTSSTDHYHGYHSVMVSNRHHHWEGLSQNVQLTGGSVYQFTAYIKLLNMASGNMYEKVQTLLGCDLNNGNKLYLPFETDLFVMENIWTEIGGINKVPIGSHNCHFYIQLSSQSVNYLIDKASLQLVSHDANWKTKAKTRIDKIRKSNITISLSGTHNRNYDIEITQTKHEFGFGTAVGANQIVDPNYSKYTQTIYDNFEWAVLESSLKWSQMERTKGHINHATSRNALQALNNKGIKVRAHNIFWGVEQFVPSWVRSSSDTELPQLMSQRINDVVSLTRNLVEHWDVNNENLHGDWYEQHTGDPNITMKMFRDTHSVDHNVKLFLNDYGIMESGMALPLANQAKLFKASNVPIYGVGIQSHLTNMNFDPNEYMLILDNVASAGLPIWITELTLKTTDENVKARALDDIMTLYFSHPSVEGVLLWGFWENKIYDKTLALFEGDNVTPNAAGRKWQQLFKSRWRTHVTTSVHDDGPFTVRGFKGDYKIKVKHNGHVIKHETFKLNGNGQTLRVDVGPSSPSIVVG
ncbi:hypothetical protein ACF0H5_021378 [Mactra antiquata]